MIKICSQCKHRLEKPRIRTCVAICEKCKKKNSRIQGAKYRRKKGIKVRKFYG